MGIANDIVSMGRQPTSTLRIIPADFLGLFAVGYAVGGITLRSKIWKVFIPLFAVHMSLLAFLAHALS